MGGGMHGAGARLRRRAGMACMGAGASRTTTSSSAAAASAARAAPLQSRGGFGFMPSFFFMRCVWQVHGTA